MLICGENERSLQKTFIIKLYAISEVCPYCRHRSILVLKSDRKCCFDNRKLIGFHRRMAEARKKKTKRFMIYEQEHVVRFLPVSICYFLNAITSRLSEPTQLRRVTVKTSLMKMGAMEIFRSSVKIKMLCSSHSSLFTSVGEYLNGVQMIFRRK